MRKQAEKLPASGQAKDLGIAVHDPLELITELQTFQIELKLQHEEVLRSQRELMEAKIRYTNLYDTAPVGYITVKPDGVIQKSNLTFANMPGVNRSSMIQTALSRYMDKENQDAYYLYLKKMAKTGLHAVCRLRLNTKTGGTMDVRVESHVVEAGSGNPWRIHSIISDISVQKQIEEDRERLIGELEKALENIQTLKGLIPICAHCKKFGMITERKIGIGKGIKTRKQSRFSLIFQDRHM